MYTVILDLGPSAFPTYVLVFRVWMRDTSAEELEEKHIVVFAMSFDSLLGRSMKLGIAVLEKKRAGAHGFVRTFI